MVQIGTIGAAAVAGTTGVADFSRVFALGDHVCFGLDAAFGAAHGGLGFK